MSSERSRAARRRLDDLLVERRLYLTRARARDAVLRGTVSVAGAVVDRPGARFSADSAVTVDDPGARYVSRAALKLAFALDRFGISPRARLCLDLGASTGGFTQVLLERGASGVIAVDVGHGQMAADLMRDSRTTLLEGVNARDLSQAHVPEPPSLVVCDVSFISLKLALPPALALAAPGADLVALIKPQFEAGREALGRGGVVRDDALLERVSMELTTWLDAQPGWRVTGSAASPIAGGDGNREHLVAARKA